MRDAIADICVATAARRSIAPTAGDARAMPTPPLFPHFGLSTRSIVVTTRGINSFACRRVAVTVSDLPLRGHRPVRLSSQSSIHREEDLNVASEIRDLGCLRPTEVQSFARRIEMVSAQIRSVRAKSARRCRDLLDCINDIFDEARTAGLPRKELKAHMKAIELARKLKAVRDDLELDDFDRLAVALGPLDEVARGLHQRGTG